LVLSALVVSVFALGACDFFNELQSADSETGEGDGDGDGDGESGSETGGECTLQDDMCVSQDNLLSCNFETGELEDLNCANLCAPNINVACMMAPSTVHACWCAVPGDIKIDSCTQLESCLNNCGPAATEECGWNCLDRTDASTVRLLGALLSCADIACDQICKDDINVCADCLLSARAGLYGDCSIERSTCDQDSSEPWP
jgi:hypothetical protein